MWKKLFFGASKRFANDVANIAGNEMKKKMKQQQHTKYEEDSSSKERAQYLNRLRSILIKGKEELISSSNYIEQLEEMDKMNVDLDQLNMYVDEIFAKKDLFDDIYDELDDMWEIGEDFGARYDDYTVKFKSQAVQDLIAEVNITLAGIIDMITVVKTATFDEEEYMEKRNEFYAEREELIEKIDTLYDELTNTNIVHVYHQGQTFKIDYNKEV